MYLQIAGFNIKLNGVTEKKTIETFKEYTNGDISQNIDLEITYIEDDNIKIEKNDFMGPYKKWYYKENEKGFEMAKFAECVDRAISHIIVDTECGKATFKNWNISKLINVDLFYSVFFTISEIYSLYILNKEAIVFHSSSIIYDDGAICFSGESGVGKSTHTSLWQQYYNTLILNDDSPTLRIIDNKPYACGTPFAGSSGINTNKIVPLKAIVFLEQAKENSIKTLSAHDALLRFLNETKKPLMKNYIIYITKTFNRLYSMVPMYLLSCNISKEAVDLVKDTLR